MLHWYDSVIDNRDLAEFIKWKRRQWRCDWQRTLIAEFRKKGHITLTVIDYGAFAEFGKMNKDIVCDWQCGPWASSDYEKKVRSNWPKSRGKGYTHIWYYINKVKQQSVTKPHYLLTLTQVGLWKVLSFSFLWLEQCSDLTYTWLVDALLSSPARLSAFDRWW